MDTESTKIHGNTQLNISWTIVQTVILNGLAIFTVLKTPEVLAKPDPGENTVRVRVESHQFYWQYEYLDENGQDTGVRSFDTLYLPVGRTAQLDLVSYDVPHSWWVPELTGKLDALPGRTNRLRFKTQKTGTFPHGKCGELCGIQHAVMATTVRVVSEDEFARWLEENAPTDEEGSLVALGKDEWLAACAKCHGVDGEGDIGPSVAGNGTLQNPEALRRLLYEGQDLATNDHYMPPVGRGWDDRQIGALVAYVKSNRKLREGTQEGGAEDGG